MTAILNFIKYLQAYSIIAKVLKAFPVLRFFTFTLPLGIALDLFARGVKRHFITLRASIPNLYSNVFKMYAAEFVSRFGLSALTSFQHFVKIITVFWNSVLASLFFISLKFYTYILAILKYPFVLFIAFYVDFFPLFASFFKPLLEKSSHYLILPVYNSLFLLSFLMLSFLMLRFLLSLLSVINQIRLIFNLCVDHIQSLIMLMLAESTISESTKESTKDDEKLISAAAPSAEIIVEDKKQIHLNTLSADELSKLSVELLILQKKNLKIEKKK